MNKFKNIPITNIEIIARNDPQEIVGHELEIMQRYIDQYLPCPDWLDEDVFIELVISNTDSTGTYLEYYRKHAKEQQFVEKLADFCIKNKLYPNNFIYSLENYPDKHIEYLNYLSENGKPEIFLKNYLSNVDTNKINRKGLDILFDRDNRFMFSLAEAQQLHYIELVDINTIDVPKNVPESVKLVYKRKILEQSATKLSAMQQDIECGKSDLRNYSDSILEQMIEIYPIEMRDLAARPTVIEFDIGQTQMNGAQALRMNSVLPLPADWDALLHETCYHILPSYNYKIECAFIELMMQRSSADSVKMLPYNAKYECAFAAVALAIADDWSTQILDKVSLETLQKIDAPGNEMLTMVIEKKLMQEKLNSVSTRKILKL